MSAPILLATGNPHKLDELRAIFGAAAGAAKGAPGAAGVVLQSLKDLAQPIDEPVEDGETFEANAIKKATHYARTTGMPCLADDSGLAVDALGGAPGVRSARYSGAKGNRSEVDLANNRVLLERLDETPVQGRGARFVCAMALVAPPAEGGDAEVLALVRGTIEGRILLPAEASDPARPELGRGGNGFGYDPLFLVPELGQTTAELPAEHKNRISHRGKAARSMYDKLCELGFAEPPATQN